MLDIKRFEIKYYIQESMVPELRQFIRPFSKFDPYVNGKNGKNAYVVRSIYYDSLNLDYYYEKMDGLKLRKKLRIRSYDQERSTVFIEIKRKYSNCIYKERINLPFQEVRQIIGELEIPADGNCNQNHLSRLISQKFL